MGWWICARLWDGEPRLLGVARGAHRPVPPRGQDRRGARPQLVGGGGSEKGSLVHARACVFGSPWFHYSGEVALLLAAFVGTSISHMVMETRGKVYVATPEHRFLHTLCFSDPHHSEERHDQGNEAYGVVYELWMRTMCSLYGHIATPRHAPQKGSWLAGHTFGIV